MIKYIFGLLAVCSSCYGAGIVTGTISANPSGGGGSVPSGVVTNGGAAWLPRGITTGGILVSNPVAGGSNWWVASFDGSGLAVLSAPDGFTLDQASIDAEITSLLSTGSAATATTATNGPDGSPLVTSNSLPGQLAGVGVITNSDYYLVLTNDFLVPTNYIMGITYTNLPSTITLPAGTYTISGVIYDVAVGATAEMDVYTTFSVTPANVFVLNMRGTVNNLQSWFTIHTALPFEQSDNNNYPQNYYKNSGTITLAVPTTVGFEAAHYIANNVSAFNVKAGSFMLFHRIQ